MNADIERTETVSASGLTAWYRKDPALVWAIAVGFIASWIYIAPIAFNQGALDAAMRQSSANVMALLMPYPHVCDDRVALYMSALITLVIAVAVGTPIVVRRVLTWWTVVTLLLSLLIGLLLIFVWVPTCNWLWGGLGVVAVLGGICVACKVRVFGVVRKPAGWFARSLIVKWLIVLLSVVEVYLVIPAASGAYAVTKPADMKDESSYVLLHMKDRESPLHEEIVELLLMSTDYLVVRLSDKVPHPLLDPEGPTTLPVENEEGTFSERAWLPMLVRRDSIDIMTLSLDPEYLIAALRKVLSRLPVTTQPTFKIGRFRGGVKVWSEYPEPAAGGATRPAVEP